MTKDEIGKIIDPEFLNVYAPTTHPTKLILENEKEIVGYFEFTKESIDLEKDDKYTFIEFGENAQNYKATGNAQYLTIVEGKSIKSVEYPSYSSVLLRRLQNIKKILDENTETNWEHYKEVWIKSINELQATIMYKWLNEYQASGLMTFAILPIKRYENKLGEYLTTSLEIVLNNQRAIIVEPIAGITSDYNGKLDFYMIGNVYKKVSILRKIQDTGQISWVLAKSYDPNDYFILNQQLFLKQIDEWLH